MKTLLTLTAVLFSFASSFSQTTLLLKNVNLRAKELRHDLNSSQDTLMLDATNTIFKVEIYNDDYSKSLDVSSKAVNISLNDLPLGRFIVEAVLKDKRIIMTLVRAHDISAPVKTVIKNTSINNPKPEIKAQEDLSNLKDLQTKINKQKHIKATAKAPRTPKSYWVEYVISNGNSSYKTFRFASKKLVDKMVAKNKLEVKSVKGKLNQLTIWEIYDTTQFLRFKRVNPEFSKTNDSEYFNVKPYYDSQNYMANL